MNDRFTLLQVIVIETVRSLRQKFSEDLSNPTYEKVICQHQTSLELWLQFVFHPTLSFARTAQQWALPYMLVKIKIQHVQICHYPAECCFDRQSI
jgi:hypothetical protein